MTIVIVAAVAVLLLWAGLFAGVMVHRGLTLRGETHA